MDKKYIYFIINNKNNKRYVGMSESKKNIGENTILDLEFKKYGKRAFSKEILYELKTCELEEDFLKLFSKDLKAQILEKKESNWTNLGKNAGGANGTARKVICLNNEKVFESGAEAGIYAGVSKSSINKACRPGHPTRIAGRNPETKEYLRWMYLEEFEAIQKGIEYTPEPSKMIRKNLKLTPVYCITTDEEFESVKKASDTYNIRPSAIFENCNYFTDFAGVHPETGEKLKWTYVNKRFIANGKLK